MDSSTVTPPPLPSDPSISLPQIVPPPLPVPHPSKLKWLLGGLSILILGILAGYAATNVLSQSKKQVATPPKNSPSTFSTLSSPTPLPAGLSAEALAKVEASAKGDDPTSNWKRYLVKTVNLEFKLPPTFNSYGDLMEKIEPGEKGTLLCITFPTSSSYHFINPIFAGGTGCQIHKFGLGTISVDYEAGRGGSFTDVLGYVIKNGKYYGRQVGNSVFELPPLLTTPMNNSNGMQILKIIGKNETSGEWRGPVGGTPGDGKIGAILNTKNPLYPGIAIEMELNSTLTEGLFDQILSTFQFTQ
ncbi:MAG: hypothetical protein Q8L37_03280 [Candidatus Gottesmanbacteria bacterium]|nr:hypothetical protein [Candidatus Gottesmanbacteria bacterium]